MNQSLFKPKSDVEQYLDNPFNTDLYNKLISSSVLSGMLEPLDFFNTLYKEYYVIRYQDIKPLEFKKNLPFRGLISVLRYHLLDALLQLIQQEYNLPTSRSFLSRGYQTLDETSRMFLEEDLRSHAPYNSMLQQKYAIFLTLINEHKILAGELGLAGAYYAKIMKEEENECTPNFKISSKRGAKTNLFRILNAVYELHLVESVNGDRLTKKQFFDQMGLLFGTEYSLHSQLMAQAMKASKESYLSIFDDIKNQGLRQWESYNKGEE